MSTPTLESQQQVSRLTGRDENEFVIYEPDARTPRAFFEVVNGRVTMADDAPATQAIHRIPSEYSTCFRLLHRWYAPFIVNGWLDVCHTLSRKQENDVYDRAVAAGFLNIDELIEFLKRCLENSGT